MQGRKAIVVTSGVFTGVCAVAYLFTGVISHRSRCDQIAGGSVSSPDGRWVAVSAGNACPVGFLSVTDYSVSVKLGSKSANPLTKPTVIFESTDAGEPPTLSWVSQNELVVRLNDPGDVQTSKHENAGVKISYLVPRWIWMNTGTIEADRMREEAQARELYKDGKIDEKDLRSEIETTNAVAKERSGFRQWIADNATVEAPSN